MSLRPRAGALVIAFESSEILGDCLAALVAQTRPFERVLVVDNASTDSAQSRDIAARYGVEWFASDVNLGFAAGNNLGFRELDDCDWIATVNPDAVLSVRWLETMLAATIKYPAAASLASRLFVHAAPTIIDGAGDTLHVLGHAFRIGHGRRDDSSFSSDRRVFGACAAAALFDRRRFCEVGGFDDSFFCYMEDVDIAFRLRLAGAECVYVADALAWHRGSYTTGGERSAFSVYHGHRNMVWTFVKNMPGFLFWALLPVHVAGAFLAMALLAARGQLKLFLQAKRDALIGLPRAWRARRVVQALRKVRVREVWHVLDKSVAGRR
jgi:GT2 family glycosyltransferase